MSRLQRTVAAGAAIAPTDVSAGALARAVLAVALAAALAGCSAPYDPTPPRDEPLRTLRIDSPLDMESSYRRLYTRLDACLAGSGYHVHPRFDRDAGQAWLLVTQGLRLERYAAFVSRFAARFDVHPQPPGARVEITQRDADLQALVDAAQGWLAGTSERCAP